MRGKDAGTPGTPGIPEPSPGYDQTVQQSQDKSNEAIYELADEPIYDDVTGDLPEIPQLPEIPNDDNSSDNGGGGAAPTADDDFDDLQARFNALKKK